MWPQFARDKGEPKHHYSTLESADDTTDASSEQRYVCRACGVPVTTATARMSIGGRAEHTFANPGADVYTIGCFADAQNLVVASEPSSLFTWFPGYQWQVTICAGCGLHLGWLYTAVNRFYGLIMDRLYLQEKPP
ncbi:MAG: hypothetical protein JXR76_09990 [Deltaproteobacteria bacterium]|nr:hypothetical protein [Deltaproteobacteria bacterium]